MNGFLPVNRQTQSTQWLCDISKVNVILDGNKESLRKFKYETDSMREMAESGDIDQKYFWYLVNKHRKHSNVTSPIRNNDGKILTNENDIRDEWNVYYQQLYKLAITRVTHGFVN